MATYNFAQVVHEALVEVERAREQAREETKAARKLVDDGERDQKRRGRAERAVTSARLGDMAKRHSDAIARERRDNEAVVQQKTARISELLAVLKQKDTEIKGLRSNSALAAKLEATVAQKDAVIKELKSSAREASKLASAKLKSLQDESWQKTRQHWEDQRGLKRKIASVRNEKKTDMINLKRDHRELVSRLKDDASLAKSEGTKSRRDSARFAGELCSYVL